MNAATVDAIRATFLYTFDCFAVSVTEVADLPEVGNVRYAREILGLLQTHNLVAESDVNGEEMVWQTVPINIDDSDHAVAESVIDAWLADNMDATTKPVKPAKAPRSKPTKANPAGLPLCLCGCGVAGKSNYRPGHDARHAGNVAREVLAGRIAVTGILAAVHGSEALAGKVAAQVQRGNDKASKGTATPRQARTPKARLQGSPAWVKVGRWIKQGEVGATTVDANGKETADSEVVAINYIGKGGEVQVVAIDNAKYVRGVNWDLGSPVA